MTNNTPAAQDYVIDATRHHSIFDPARFGETRVDIIGAGATGSSIALMIAKLGVRNIHVWDFDVIEEHNLANQMYGPSHIGMPKVEALREVIHYMTGLTINIHNEKVTEDTDIPGAIVYLLVDSVAARREIAENCLDGNMVTRTVIETRMGKETGFIYTFNPNTPSAIRDWMETLPASDDDADVERSPCGTPITVGMTANLVASLAVWQFVRAARFEWREPDNDEDEIPDFRISFAVRPYLFNF